MRAPVELTHGPTGSIDPGGGNPDGAAARTGDSRRYAAGVPAVDSLTRSANIGSVHSPAHSAPVEVDRESWIGSVHPGRRRRGV